MKIVPFEEVRNNFAKYLDACEEGPVFVTRNGKIAAALERMREKHPRVLRIVPTAKWPASGACLPAGREAG